MILMKPERLRACLQIIATSLMIASCAPQGKTAAEPQDALPAANAAQDLSDDGQPVRYCYHLEAETFTSSARFAATPDGAVTGMVQGTIHHQEAGYFSGYRRSVTGTLDDGSLDATVVTWIENDRQVETETWTLTDALWDDGRDIYPAADCAGVDRDFIEAAGGDVTRLLPFDQEAVHRKHVSFEKNSFGTTLSGAVIRGQRDVYVLGARGAQTMTLNIASFEDNAVFDVLSPSGIILARETTSEDLHLPHRGDYMIIVGGTRGNATYTLNVMIR